MSTQNRTVFQRNISSPQAQNEILLFDGTFPQLHAFLTFEMVLIVLFDHLRLQWAIRERKPYW